MRKFAAVLLGVLGFCMVTLGNAPAIKGSTILATVNGEAVTLGDVLRESAGNEALARVYAADEITAEIARLRQAAVDRIIERKLLVAEFKRLNLMLPKEYVESMLDDLALNLGCKSRSDLAAKARLLGTSIEELRSKAEERLMAEMVIGRQVYGAHTPTPEEIFNYFLKHEDDFSVPEKIKLALLLLPENTEQKNIDEIAAQLNADSGRFAELVKAFSCGPNRQQGGEVGFIERKNLRNEFASVLIEGAVEADKIYGPVTTPEGIYFLKIITLEAGKKADFASCRDHIRSLLEQNERNNAISELLKNLRERATIQYYFGRTPEADAAPGEKDTSDVITTTPPESEPAIATEKKIMVTLKTNYGDIKLELFADAAPKTVANFLEYVKSGFYNGTLFHRVIDNFMIQGGGFDQNFKQKATRAPIENEADNGISNEIGTIAMARTMDPHSATAQFFINVANNDFLDFRSPSPQYYGYCVFGKVVDGMDVVNKIKGVATGGRSGHQDVPVEDVVILEAVLD